MQEEPMTGWVFGLMREVAAQHEELRGFDGCPSGWLALET